MTSPPRICAGSSRRSTHNAVVQGPDFPHGHLIVIVWPEVNVRKLLARFHGRVLVFAHLAVAMSAARLSGQKKGTGLENALLQRGHMKLAIRLQPRQRGLSKRNNETRNDTIRKNRSSSGGTSSNIHGMCSQRSSSQSIATEASARQAASNERLVGILMAPPIDTMQ